MRYLLLIFSFHLSLSVFGQPGGNRGGQMPNGRFYGKIVDAANKGIEAASIVLAQDRMDTATKQRKEVIIGGMLTSANGEFSIDNIPVMGRYKLRITGIGYKTLEKPVNFEMPNRGTGNDMSSMLGALDKDLGNIKLEIDDKVLENVTVSASKPLLQMGIDRKIFNVDRNITSAGGTAIDVMRNVPSIAVDVDGNVTLRNNAPQIFVDGRPTNLTLEQIPADAIESIEIITNPSAKFDASGGTAGILNIVLKKQRRVGYAGNFRANIDSRARVGGGGDINVRQNKVNFFAAGNVGQRKSISTGNTERINTRPRVIRSYQDDRNVMEGIFGFGRAGFDYFISNRNTLTLSGTMVRGNMNPENRSDIFTDFANNGSIDSLQERIADSENKFRNMGSQVSFKHNFPKAGREWTADVTYNRGRNSNSNVIRTDYFGQPNKVYDRAFQQSQASNGNNENLIIQTDYVNPIKANSKFEIGARAMIRKFDNTQRFFASSNNSPAVAQPELDIIFKSDDRVYATYATFSNRIKNFGYQLGLRAESSDYTGNLVNKNQSFNIDFPISLFPSVFLSQKLTDFDDLQLNYSRRINRPGFWQLFPFYDLSDSLNISRGNPNLNPEFTNSLELSYSKQFKNRDNLIASIYFKNTTDLITRFQVLESIAFYKDSLPVLTYINANNSYVTGLELISRNKITKFWDLTTNANFFTSKIDLEDAPDPDQFLSYFFKINNSFRLPKNLSFQLSGDYTSKIISAPGGGGGGFGGGGGGRGGGGGFGGGGFGGGQGSAAQGFIRANYGVDAAVRFEFMKNKVASLSLNVNDIFRTKKYDAFTEQPGFFLQNIERRRDPRVFRLNFNYRFGKFDASLFKRRNNRVEGEGMDSGGVGM
jgi:outer membrane receptor protein involved in Fe transport